MTKPEEGRGKVCFMSRKKAVDWKSKVQTLLKTLSFILKLTGSHLKCLSSQGRAGSDLIIFLMFFLFLFSS